MPSLQDVVAVESNKLATAWCDIMGKHALYHLVRDPLGMAALGIFSDFAYVDNREERKRALQQCAKWIKREIVPLIKTEAAD